MDGDRDQHAVCCDMRYSAIFICLYEGDCSMQHDAVSSYPVVGAWADGQAVRSFDDADISTATWYNMVLCRVIVMVDLEACLSA
jgi:hypothetical protein